MKLMTYFQIAVDFAHAQWMCEMINASNSLQSLQDHSQADSETAQTISEEEKQYNLQQQAFLDRLNSHIQELGFKQLACVAHAASQDCR
ncbi:hypothetical protein MJO28_017142 [Puccinia striiformis f. sp. tritici]|nr:hypothetical protein MJO28_017142 [Puccinia striiformis f. sp. tritici]